MAAPGATDTIVVVTGGDPVPVAELAHVPHGAFVIAADSGIEHAHALGLRIDLAIGDFDSVAPAALDRARVEGAEVQAHPAAKDATDLELALDAATRRRPGQVIVLGGHGGRLDHLLANAALLASPHYAHVGLVAHMGGATITVVRDRAELRGRHGELVSLMAVHGPALGVRTTGLLYPLDHDALLPGSTRGVSNELVDDPATVEVAAGVLLVVQPGQLGTHHQKRTPR